MSKIEVNFQFEIGEIVYFRNARFDTNHDPKKHLIVERYAQQCHGGIQQLYHLDGIDRLVSEVALTHDKPRYETLPMDHYQEELTKQRLSRSEWRNWFDTECAKVRDDERKGEKGEA